MQHFALLSACLLGLAASCGAFAPPLATPLSSRASPAISAGRGVTARPLAGGVLGKGRSGALMGLRMGKNVDVVTAEELELAVHDSELPLVVDFYTDWCGPCRLIAPQLETVAEEFKGKVKFLKIDTDVHEEIASNLKVYALPTLIFFKGGKALGRVEGAMMAPKIKKMVDYSFFDGPKPEDIDTMYVTDDEDDLLV